MNIKPVNISFNRNITKDGFVSFSDIVNDKQNQLHTEMFNDALLSFVELNNIDKNAYTFIEVPGSTYIEPSDVILVSKEFPFTRETVSLLKYWNSEYLQSLKKDINNFFLAEDAQTNAEIIYINYVDGKCKMRSKENGKEFYIPFDYINGQIPINPEYTLEGTFGDMWKRKNNLLNK